MKFVPWLAAAVVCLAAHGQTPRVRVTESFDQDWRFHRGDPTGAQAPSFDDSRWRKLDVPHDWAIEGPFNQRNPTGKAGGFLPAGIGWYRKTFAASERFAGKEVLVEFGGVMANSDVWINGYHLGHRPYGYISFRCNLTGHLDLSGRPNVLAVRVDDSRQPASRWYAGAGIYRHVRLLLLNPVHLQPWGTFVTTPELRPDHARVTVRNTVTNESGRSQTVRIEERIFAPGGEMVAKAQTPPRTITAGKIAVFTTSFSITNPQRWDIEHPALYHAGTRLELAGTAAPEPAGTPLDDEITPFGIRDFRFDAATGFWLNGRQLKLKGVCLHADGGAFGTAVPLSIWRRRLAALKRLGANAIRTAHNPPATGFLDLCDQMGFLVMDEAFDCWTVGKKPYDYHLYFRQWSKTDLRDMVLRDRNHPGIILWSVGNEIHDTPDAALAKGILAGLLQVCHENDPTRPVTQALLWPNKSHDFEDGLADMLDVIGVNYEPRTLKAAHAAKPTRRILGTENNHELKSWLAARNDPAYSGEFIWTGIDYLGEARAWPLVASDAGLLDLTARPRADGHIVQSWWSGKPMVYLARRIPPPAHRKAPPRRHERLLSADWNPATTGPHQETVEVYSNCREVELFLNGRSLGRQTRRANLSPRLWTVTYAPGTLRAVGRNRGRIVAETELRTAGAPARIQLAADCARLVPGWDNVAVVSAVITDSQGVPVPNAAAEVSFHVRGPGRIVATDSADNTSHELFQAAHRRAFQGRCEAMIRATAPAGKITVSAMVPGLASRSVSLTAAANQSGLSRN